ncbi:MAG: beta strand repeat-containing protein [Steroidobacteraceae bacterium]
MSGKTTVSVVATQETITLLTSQPQMPSDNSKPTTITAIVQGANNQLLPGVAVSFKATSGAIDPVQTTAGAAAQVVAGTTDANGQAQATLTTPTNQSNRTITVTAALGSGSTTATIAIAVVGTKIAVTGPTSLIMGNPGTFNVSLTDAGGNGISGQIVTLASASGNTLSAPTVSTDTTGHATFQLTAKVAGNDTVSATALGLTGTAPLTVSSQNFAFTAPTIPTGQTQITVPIGTAQGVTLVWTNGGNAVVNQPVTFSTTRGVFANNQTTTTATTDSTGTAVISVSSMTAGPAIISAAATGVTAQLALTFIATTPAAINVQASPATISTQGQSTITAIVRDAQNNLVEGQTVDFQLTDKTGGAISAATAVTDVQGQAQTVYTATTTASTSNGVQVTATVQGTSIQDTASLTVGGQTVFLSLGTGNVVSANSTDTQFSVPYVIQALDSSGHAVSGVTVSLTVHSLPPSANNSGPPSYSTNSTHYAYAKGQWFLTGGTPAWAQGNGALNTPIVYCLNEDVNGTGIYEAAEDLNNNGKLDPGDVAAVTPGSITTDSTGSGNVNVTYPEDHALWVQVILTATASVNGTQSSTTAVFPLPIEASKIGSAGTSPPGVNSPYGITASCSNPN